MTRVLNLVPYWHSFQLKQIGKLKMKLLPSVIAALAEAVEAYTTCQKQYTFDAMEQEMLKSKKMLEGES